VGFFRYREIYPDGLRRWWLGNAGWREPTSSDRLPSIGVSLQPAIPRRVAPQQSPLPLHQSPTIVPQIPVRRGNQNARLNLTARLQSRSPSSCPSPRGCHLYFARRVTFLSCADMRRFSTFSVSSVVAGLLESRRRPFWKVGAGLATSCEPRRTSGTGRESPSEPVLKRMSCTTKCRLRFLAAARGGEMLPGVQNCAVWSPVSPSSGS
jgi:hypothetical protein